MGNYRNHQNIQSITKSTSCYLYLILYCYKHFKNITKLLVDKYLPCYQLKSRGLYFVLKYPNNLLEITVIKKKVHFVSKISLFLH